MRAILPKRDNSGSPRVSRRSINHTRWCNARRGCPIDQSILLLAPRLEHHKGNLQTSSKEESAAEFRRWLCSTPPSTLVVYSDGSLSESGSAGYGQLNLQASNK
ncbi:uncharacterized protein LMH87_007531 [Akanthomyces muscarius]|uniref:Uncharacterized protein n=1 Tax=Akanthomyces muscarius TaxID=2231603 RepID=A0A9W8QM67_AKAMU|nr:uncharacterized protein LMH87_007531 [Akanthomyces muscarius]KAJ4159590.1 hypothetical protein LMH87_007531 [Akanthomyces muscarius]